MVIHSKWSRLFPLLKKKNAIYIYGNHDDSRFCDERVSLFSVEHGYSTELKRGEYTYSIQHGQLTYKNFLTKVRDLIPNSFVMKMNIWATEQQKKGTVIGWLKDEIEAYAERTGDETLQGYVKKLPKQNKYTYYVFGHTHTRHFSEDGGYLNPGKFTVLTPGYIYVQEKATLEESYV
jgi:UDP-2,3-diacylglucosamine pyrophosphatase LpxH